MHNRLNFYPNKTRVFGMTIQEGTGQRARGRSALAHFQPV
jgi:hypothetical protein